jgi:8-oxo-dGTP pyrophosphatase MutT (NUDIX family)
MYIINIVTTPRSLSDSNLRAGSHPARTKGVRVICKPPAWPVSVKGVAIKASGRVVLLKNERQEWELPGGKLEIGSDAGGPPADESPERAVEREFFEETGWHVTAGPLLPGGTWIYEPRPGCAGAHRHLRLHGADPAPAARSEPRAQPGRPVHCRRG